MQFVSANDPEQKTKSYESYTHKEVIMQKKTLKTAIVKTGQDHFIKYRNISNIKSLIKYLDKKYKDWRYINLYDKETKEQICSYTKNNRPV